MYVCGCMGVCKCHNIKLICNIIMWQTASREKNITSRVSSEHEQKQLRTCFVNVFFSGLNHHDLPGTMAREVTGIRRQWCVLLGAGIAEVRICSHDEKICINFITLALLRGYGLLFFFGGIRCCCCFITVAASLSFFLFVANAVG